jgi:hypothetical protein
LMAVLIQAWRMVASIKIRDDAVEEEGEGGEGESDCSGVNLATCCEECYTVGLRRRDELGAEGVVIGCTGWLEAESEGAFVKHVVVVRKGYKSSRTNGRFGCSNQRLQTRSPLPPSQKR